ncbi:MAG: hypothetical protein WCU88_12275 [Elusimicrobiota bacterium]
MKYTESETSALIFSPNKLAAFFISLILLIAAPFPARCASGDARISLPPDILEETLSKMRTISAEMDMNDELREVLAHSSIEIEYTSTGMSFPTRKSIANTKRSVERDYAALLDAKIDRQDIPEMLAIHMIPSMLHEAVHSVDIGHIGCPTATRELEVLGYLTQVLAYKDLKQRFPKAFEPKTPITVGMKDLEETWDRLGPAGLRANLEDPAWGYTRTPSVHSAAELKKEILSDRKDASVEAPKLAALISKTCGDENPQDCDKKFQASKPSGYRSLREVELDLQWYEDVAASAQEHPDADAIIRESAPYLDERLEKAQLLWCSQSPQNCPDRALSPNPSLPKEIGRQFSGKSPF